MNKFFFRISWKCGEGVIFHFLLTALCVGKKKKQQKTTGRFERELEPEPNGRICLKLNAHQIPHTLFLLVWQVVMELIVQ